MSQLKPGAQYVYERNGSNVYAREMGSTDRILIGSDYQTEHRMFGLPLEKIAGWVDILNEAEHNPALQDALNRVKVIYELSKKESLQHHPV